MGPTNIALVKLFKVDQALHAAEERYEAAAKSVRFIERRVKELTAKAQASHQALREQQSQAAQLDLDLKARDARIEKLRTQQQQAHNHKEYQAFLTEINTEKVDRNKLEDQTIAVLEVVERMQGELKAIQGQLQDEQKKLEDANAQIGDRLAKLQAAVDELKPGREEAFAAVPLKARSEYDRVSDRHGGEAMAELQKPDPRNEEYICGACNMSLVVDVYNRLHSRDDLVHCPNCFRLLFIPDELPPEVAVHRPKEVKEPREPRPPKEKKRSSKKDIGAAIGRQTAAADVVNSITVEEEPPAAAPAPPAQDAPPVEGA